MTGVLLGVIDFVPGGKLFRTGVKVGIVAAKVAGKAISKSRVVMKVTKASKAARARRLAKAKKLKKRLKLCKKMVKKAKKAYVFVTSLHHTVCRSHSPNLQLQACHQELEKMPERTFHEKSER